MSESATTTSTSSAAGVDPPTEEIFVAGAEGEPGSPPGGPDEPRWEGGATDDDSWPDRGPRRGIRMPVATVALLALLIAAGGIWGGAALQRSQGTTPAASSAASAFASLFAGRGGAGGGATPGGAGAVGAATTGTVTEVTGSTLYVTDSSGNLVKVTVTPSSTVTRNAKSSLGTLQVGDTVVVAGTKASNGSVTATSVSATGAGVTSPFGGLGGRPGTGAPGG